MSKDKQFEIAYQSAYKRFESDLLTPKETMEYLRISRTTLDKLRASDKGLLTD